ncbi:MAG: glycosyltransferase [Chlamydiae bacterium]|nr:glycosyltransferase [Chlamydiota bacterium]
MTVCLNMIVKDEERVIERCLSSVKDWIDYWVIVDTGSSDGTKSKIIHSLRDIPGELFDRPWVNFGWNRNEALKLAKTKADYLLFIDADDRLIISKSFKKPIFTKDVYIAIQQDESRSVDTRCLLLANANLDWRWEGVAHESLVCKDVKSAELLQGVINLYGHDGSRSQDPKKSEKVTQLLLEEKEKNPFDTKPVFYLASTYFSAKNYLASKKMYEQRVSMGGFEEEIFWSLYSIAKIEELLEKDPNTVLQSLIRAHERRPARMEPIYDIILLYRKMGRVDLAYALAKKSYDKKIPASDVIFVHAWIYEWGILWQYAICACELNHKDEAQAVLQKLRAISNLPDSLKAYIG